MLVGTPHWRGHIFAKSIVAIKQKKKKHLKKRLKIKLVNEKNWRNGEITTCKLNNKTHHQFFPREETPQM